MNEGFVAIDDAHAADALGLKDHRLVGGVQVELGGVLHRLGIIPARAEALHHLPMPSQTFLAQARLTNQKIESHPDVGVQKDDPQPGQGSAGGELAALSPGGMPAGALTRPPRGP
jgi:hypothetical protein